MLQVVGIESPQGSLKHRPTRKIRKHLHNDHSNLNTLCGERIFFSCAAAEGVMKHMQGQLTAAPDYMELAGVILARRDGSD